MNIAIFGLGYVGVVTSGCLAQRGHRIIGVDVQAAKVRAMREGRSPIVEPGLDALLAEAHAAGRLEATTEAAEAVATADLSLVCVGTPGQSSGRLSLEAVRKVCAQIEKALSAKSESHALVFRSTMLPGSTRQLVADYFSGPVQSGRLRVYFCPEFLREGSALSDFHAPALTVVGTSDGQMPTDDSIKVLLGDERQALNWEEAEMLKYACNAFHALKAGFANEIGRLGKALGVNGARVLEIFCRDTKLNVSPSYLRPGNPFGGSCLPKDVSAIASLARLEGVNLPLVNHILTSNSAHLEALIAQITTHTTRRVGMLGLSFKAGTDDLRGSPMVAVAETLLERGYQLAIYDPQVNLTRLIGANETEIQRRLPHLEKMLRKSTCEVLQESDLIVAAQACADAEALRPHVRPEHRFLDVNGWRELQSLPCGYEGFCW